MFLQNLCCFQVWIVGEYAERIDNADELLDSFLEGFHDENAQVLYYSTY